MRRRCRKPPSRCPKTLASFLKRTWATMFHYQREFVEYLHVEILEHVIFRNVAELGDLAADSVITFGLKGGRDAAVEMMDRLKMVAIVTHVADARSCVLHPASHTHRQMNDKELVEAGVQPDLIRFSVGIENIEDIIADVEQALR